ncbi:MAG: VanW family protein [Thermocrispum sp.]
MLLGAIAGVLAGLYGLDLLTAGDIPRGVVVAGVDVGGMDRTEAERVLRTRLEPRLAEPAELVAAGARTTIGPGIARVAVDWDASLDVASRTSYHPWHRLRAFFADKHIDVVATADERAIRGEFAALARRVDKPRVEGDIRFTGAEPDPVMPAPGRKLDVPGATRTVITDWAKGRPIALPVRRLDVRATRDGVRQTLDEFAKPAVSGPVTLRVNGTTAQLTPEAIGTALTFTPAADGSLTPEADPQRLRAAAGKKVAKAETKPRDARVKFGTNSASVAPSVGGKQVDWEATGDGLIDVLRRRAGRALEAPLTDTPAKLTTEELRDLGIKEVIGKFTTSGFAPDSGVNIRTIAKEVNGAIVRPAETFSLNGFTGPRGTEQGYIEAGVIKQGVPSRAVGGGISQFATTIYNAAYFAAMVDVEHKEHSYYISRYPLAREATVFQNPDGSSVIDLRFRNDAPTGVAIQTTWTPSDITVKIWGTKRYKVYSKTSEPYGYTAPPTVTKPPGSPCVPQGGASGYSADNTRIIRDLDGTVVKREKRTVVYSPQPAVQCAPPPPKPKPKPSDKPDTPSREPSGNR